MLNERELAALIGIINRTPMTPGEALFIEGVLARLGYQAPEPLTPEPRSSAQDPVNLPTPGAETNEGS